MNWLQKKLSTKFFANSTANYQKKYDSLYDKDRSKPPKGIVRRSKNVSVKVFNINADEENVLSVFYFENYKQQPDENTPVIIYFYGNSLSNKHPIHYSNYCSYLANKTNSIVIMVNCLQPPKHKFPTAHDNAVKAIKWVKETCPYWQISTDKIYVAGDILGANLGLSAVMNLKKTLKNINIAGMIFTDPIIDMSLSSSSFAKYSNSPTISKKDVQGYIDEYVQYKSQIFDKRLCISAERDLTKLPPALIITSEFSPMKDDAYLLKSKMEECSDSVFLYEQKNAYYSFIFERSARKKRTAEIFVREFIRNNDINFLKIISKKI
ncbi:MAG TPA: hypothetical protein DCO86_00655 [Spirochaetaceae bacterium]|nr:hypothetical protein [Spirochaetaceae bacterium]